MKDKQCVTITELPTRKNKGVQPNGTFIQFEKNGLKISLLTMDEIAKQ